ncbi:MAG: multifunctional response regulator receiver/nitrate/sulfonate/bicarbonate ABC transporter substrate-binding protein [Desulfobacteraceae bacterium 4572_19]|nr:MAG: multifunctional response regulator receiver/nitrate/sulfonate/bicarbonate ABC transporter substrate-binding protein [Desulfobacteraceae bacterium 4572_19]
MLTKAGFKNFVVAINGEDAIEKLKDATVDLVISDWNMPKMDGLELLKWLREQDKYKSLPFIMATAQGDKTQQAIVLDAGGNNHIAKPFDAEQIKKKVDETFGEEDDEGGAYEREVIDGKVLINVAHIQITDHLILGILKHQIETGEVVPDYFDLATHCLPGWNPVQDAIEQEQIDCAFVLAPIAMDLFAFGTPIKLTLFAHKNGSTFVRNKNYDPRFDSLQSFYKYKVVNLPHKMSVHNMLAFKFLKELGLRPGVPGKKSINVRFEVIPPIKMGGVMKENDDVAGFIVAEPIASKSIALGISELEYFSASRWEDHPCCVVIMQDDFIEQFPDAAQEFTSLLVQAGKFVEQNLELAAQIAVDFLDPNKAIGLTPEVLMRVLSLPQGIKMNNLYPVKEDLDTIQQYMFNQMGIGKLIDLDTFVDLRFAEVACKG